MVFFVYKIKNIGKYAIITEGRMQMKKIVLTAIITTIVTLGILGGITFGVSKFSQGESRNEEKIAAEELDLLPEDGNKEEYDLSKAEAIQANGEKAMLLNLDEIPLSKVYDTAVSAERSKLLDKKKRGVDATFETPMFVWNPYGTNHLALYTYFETTEPVWIRYTIRVEDAKIPDFTRTLKNEGKDNLERKHEYQITGFVPGKTNYIIWNMYNKSGKLVGNKIFSIDVPSLDSKAKVQLNSKAGELLTKEKQTNGLYCLMGEKYIWFYDNSGVLRGEIPLEKGKTCQVLFEKDQMTYAASPHAFASINTLGQVQKVFRFKGYQQEQFTYNGYGQILMIASKEDKKRKTVNDMIVSIDVKTGKTKEVLDFTKIFPKVFKQAQKENRKKKGKLDWIGLNSLIAASSDGIIVSSGKMSSIIRINSMNSAKPEIKYMIGEPENWKNTPYKKYLYEKQGQKELEEEAQASADEEEKLLETKVEVEDAFQIHANQSYIIMEQDSTLGEGMYYLDVFNSNKKPTSYWYQYVVDETNGLYGLKDSLEVPYCKENGEFYDKEKNRIYTLPANGEFMERDKENKDIRIFELPKSCTSVKKYDMKNFWYK